MRLIRFMAAFLCDGPEHEPCPRQGDVGVEKPSGTRDAVCQSVRNTHDGFAHIFLLVGVVIFGAIASVVGVHHFTLPEARELQDAAWPPWPAVPEGLRRPSVIHPNDVLDVRVAGEEALTDLVRVDDAGIIRFPIVGPLYVAGREADLVAARISSALADGYIRDPRVSVRIRQSAFHTVFVIGLVRSPGAVSTDEELTLCRILALAGGLSPGAGSTALVLRPERPTDEPTAPGTSGARTYSFSPDDETAVLEDGDTVYIRAGGMIAIIGDVSNPGLYVITPGMTVAAALATAGGTRGTSVRNIRASRFVNGRRTTIDVDLAAILTPGDILKVRSHDS